MLAVFPGCFKISYSQTHYRSLTSEMTIRADCMAGVDKEDVEMSPVVHMTVSIMQKRENVFRQNLLNMVFESHGNYLKSLSPNVAVNLDPTKLRRWHPKFPLETATPVVMAAKLPDRPEGATPRHWSAKEMLERYAANTPHLAKYVDKKSDSPKSQASVPATPKSFKVVKSGQFAGIREDLLAKVRDRERKEKELKITADPEADLARIRHSRLPKIVRIVRGLFFRETKSVKLSDLLTTVRYSWGTPISDEEVEVTFNLLVKTCPEWIRILKLSISPEPYVQIDDKIGVNSLLSKLSLPGQ